MVSSKKTLFLLFFCFALTSLSIKLKTQTMDIEQQVKINHLFYEDDLNLYAKIC